MTDPGNLRELESSLWEAADQLRANSKLHAGEYCMPVLGLIFLRHASTRAALCVPAEARYDHLVALAEAEPERLGEALDQAMALLEAEAPAQLAGVLPRGYAGLDGRLLAELLRIFDRAALRTATGDVFGRIYEYFLDNFAATLAANEGQFFTPPSLVRLIVALIEPNHGKVFDPAVGSAGMLVETAHFIERSPGEVATFIGRDKSETAVALARMNVVIHGFSADVRVANSYYDRAPELIGACDFVMANPPFNVDGVDPERLADDPRLWTKRRIPGLTRAGRISNANYLWIQYFRAYLSERGRAGFVMPASATDAGHGEQDIRRELIETGDVDVIIRVSEKFFYTRALPCTLWFLDRGKPAARRDRILMIDARAIYRTVNRRLREFSDDQLGLLTAIVCLHRGQRDRYLALVERLGSETSRAWLRARFPEHEFVAVPGLCAAVEREQIAAQGWSLNPGRYVGVAAPELEDDEDFAARMRTIHAELRALDEAAAALAEAIAADWEELHEELLE